jgi:hypothetical protein
MFRPFLQNEANIHCIIKVLKERKRIAEHQEPQPLERLLRWLDVSGVFVGYDESPGPGGARLRLGRVAKRRWWPDRFRISAQSTRGSFELKELDRCSMARGRC